MFVIQKKGEQTKQVVLDGQNLSLSFASKWILFVSKVRCNLFWCQKSALWRLWRSKNGVYMTIWDLVNGKFPSILDLCSPFGFQPVPGVDDQNNNKNIGQKGRKGSATRVWLNSFFASIFNQTRREGAFGPLPARPCGGHMCWLLTVGGLRPPPASRRGR